MKNEHTILVVDDEPYNIRLLKTDLESEGYHVLSATNGEEAWDIFRDNRAKIDAILLDRMMPVLDGMGFLALLKKDKENCEVPVIMQTAAGQKEQVMEGIQAGVFYYLIKPYDHEIMLSLVSSAVRQHQEEKTLLDELNRHRNKINIIKECHFEIKTLEEARYLTTFLSQFYPDPNTVALGISEILINGIEHGNLDISYEEKTALCANGKWLEEIERRLQFPEYRDRRVNVTYLSKDSSIDLIIKDDGNGFEWEKFMNIDPARITHNHGRGVAMANLMSFDKLEYLGVGNAVLCVVNTR